VIALSSVSLFICNVTIGGLDNYGPVNDI